MNGFIRNWLLAVSFAVLFMAGPAPQAPLGVTLVQEAEALFGVPFSPVSVAGVARRTTRRAVVYSSAAASTASVQQPVAEQQAPPAQPQDGAAHRPDGAPPIGAIAATLPKGCGPVTIGGVQYQDCKGVYYRAAFQGSKLVYVVTQP